jgi:hypothetical protein
MKDADKPIPLEDDWWPDDELADARKVAAMLYRCESEMNPRGDGLGWSDYRTTMRCELGHNHKGAHCAHEPEFPGVSGLEYYDSSHVWFWKLDINGLPYVAVWRENDTVREVSFEEIYHDPVTNR